MNAIEIKNLRKNFDNFKLGVIDMAIPSGCIVGLIGENGSGKTTLIKLILGMLNSDSGTVQIFGKDADKKRHLLNEDIGYVADDFGIPDSMTANMIGKIMKRAYRNWNEKRYKELLKRLSLSEFKVFKSYSEGMKKKLGIAIAMSHDAKLLILDEPTNALDPVVRNDFTDMLYEYTRDEDRTVFISSHIVTDLEKLCDYVAFLHDGKLMLFEEKDKLISKYCTVRCTPEQFSEIDTFSVKYKKESPYGIEAVVLREAVPKGVDIGSVSLEELFITTVKGESCSERIDN